MWIPINSSSLVLDVRDEALKKLNMYDKDTKKPQQFFGIYCVVVEGDGLISQEYFLWDTLKMIDIINYFRNKQLQHEKLK